MDLLFYLFADHRQWYFSHCRAGRPSGASCRGISHWRNRQAYRSCAHLTPSGSWAWRSVTNYQLSKGSGSCSVSRACTFLFTSARTLNPTSMSTGAGSRSQIILKRMCELLGMGFAMKGKAFKGLNSLGWTQTWVLRPALSTRLGEKPSLLTSQKPWNPGG